MVTQDVRDLRTHFKKICLEDNSMRKQDKELAGEAREKVAKDTVESARSKSVAEEFASVRLYWTPCRVDCENSR